MFYDFAQRIAFIHVPRTGGIAISLAARSSLRPEFSCWDVGAFRHISYYHLRCLFNDRADYFRYFAVYRKFDEILESLGKLIEENKRLLLEQNAVFPREWKSVLSAYDPVDFMFEQNCWPKRESEWWSYWLKDIDGTSNIRVLDFYNLRSEIIKMMEDWELDGWDLAQLR